MVLLSLREVANAVGEVECLAEVLKAIFLFEMMFVDNLQPLSSRASSVCNSCPFKGGTPPLQGIQSFAGWVRGVDA